MRKLFVVLTISVLVLSLLASTALADRSLKPEAEYVPQQVLPFPPPGFTFTDFWVELDPAFGGSGIELPQGANDPFGAFGVDDFIRGGPVGSRYQHGIPIGFDFKYMQGPEEGIPTYGWNDLNGDGNRDCPAECPVIAWTAELTDQGFDEIYASLNGYAVFDTGPFSPGTRPVGVFDGLGTRAWSPEGLPDAGVPNCFIAPFWTDLAIADNSFQEVTKVCFYCRDGEANPLPAGCGAGPGYPKRSCCANGAGYWAPCAWRSVVRPRGKLLYKTVGSEPNQVFVMQWANARNIWTDNLVTFQMQLWEGNNGILFLYKEFTTKADYEDPVHASPYLVNPGVLVGLEDWYGQTAVGWLYLPQNNGFRWVLYNPLVDGDGFGFVADKYMGVRPLVP